MKRITLDVAAGDFDFAGRYASYRNTLAEVQGERLKRLWTRKSQAESFFAIQCNEKRAQLRAMFEALGEFPPAEDKAAMRAYVERMLDWDAKLSANEPAEAEE